MNQFCDATGEIILYGFSHVNRWNWKLGDGNEPFYQGCCSCIFNSFQALRQAEQTKTVALSGLLLSWMLLYTLIYTLYKVYISGCTFC